MLPNETQPLLLGQENPGWQAVYLTARGESCLACLKSVPGSLKRLPCLAHCSNAPLWSRALPPRPLCLPVALVPAHPPIPSQPGVTVNVTEGMSLFIYFLISHIAPDFSSFQANIVGLISVLWNKVVTLSDGSCQFQYSINFKEKLYTSRGVIKIFNYIEVYDSKKSSLLVFICELFVSFVARSTRLHLCTCVVYTPPLMRNDPSPVRMWA